MSEWARGYFGAIDAMDLDRFAAYHTEDARLRFGNAPTAEGKQEVVEGIKHFWETINGLRHDFVRVWEEDDATIVESEITYTLKNNKQVVLPCTTIVRKEGDLAKDVRIYMDINPVFAEEAPAGTGASSEDA
jgi:ketosteroid isomerase-like protein